MSDISKGRPMKTALLFLNAFIFISLCLLVGFVAYGVAVTQSQDLEAGGINVMNGYPYLFAIVGYGILVTIIGGYGAIANNRSFLVFYTIMLFGLTLAVCYFFVVSILEIIKRKTISKNEVEQSMMDALRSYGAYDKPKPTNFWDSIQNMFKCCGIKLYTDWQTNSNITPNRIPSSCCVKPARPSCETASRREEFYSESGCYTRILHYMDIVKYILIALLGAIMLFSAINFFLGMCVASNT